MQELLNKNQCEMLVFLKELSLKLKTMNSFLIFFDNKTQKNYFESFFQKSRNGEIKINRLLKQTGLPPLPETTQVIVDSIYRNTFKNYSAQNEVTSGDQSSTFARFKEESINQIIINLYNLSSVLDEYNQTIYGQYSTRYFPKQ